jgi:hypothetical protein
MVWQGKDYLDAKYHIERRFRRSGHYSDCGGSVTQSVLTLV